MELGLLVLRVFVGALFVGHGAQKLFGWFGGAGPEGTGRFFESVGLRPGRTMALGAGLAELMGGALFAAGLVTPLGAALMIAVMSTAIATVHWPNGIWASEGGFEYNLVLIAAAFAVTSTGAGKWSLDHALGLHVAGPEWAVGALLAGVLGMIAALAARRLRRHGATGPTPASA
jgi:putative oxidoreductase